MSPQPRTRAPSRWSGLTTEERLRERRLLLLDAAYELLAMEGSVGTTVRAVCAKARLNPRYFYESFDDLDALMVAVYDDVVRQLRDRMMRAVAGAADDEAAIRAAVEATVHFVDEDRRRGRIMYVEAMGNEALNLRRHKMGVGVMELVQEPSTGWRSESTDSEIGKLGAAIVVGGFTELLVAWLDGRIELTTAELIDDATAVFLGVRNVMRQLGTARSH